VPEPLHPQDREVLIARYGDRYRWQIMAVISLGIVAGILPGGSFVVAIPALLEAFHAGHVEGQLVMTIFMVTNTIAMLPAPWLIQRFGMRDCFLWTMALLALTSVLGLISPNYTFLVVMRALQGVFTGTLMPMGGIVIMRLFEPRHQGRASGIMGLAVTLAPAVAPTIGGLMVDYWGWRTVWLMPLPFALLAWFAALRYLPVARETARESFDAISMLLLSVFTLAWLGAVSNLVAGGSGRLWLIVSVVLLLSSAAAFFLHARRHHSPLIGLDVLTRRRVFMGAMLSFALGFSMYGQGYLIPVYFQVVQGLDATHAGAALMPGTFALALTFPVAGYLRDAWSGRKTMLVGAVIFVVTWLVLGLFANTLTYAWFVTVLMLSRIGHGLANTPVNPAALHGLHGLALGQASALLSYVRQLGGVFGIAALAIFVDWRTPLLGEGREAQVNAYGETFILVAVVYAVFSLAIKGLRDTDKKSG
jgi:DHA2 family multidrug resistance protein